MPQQTLFIYLFRKAKRFEVECRKLGLYLIYTEALNNFQDRKVDKYSGCAILAFNE